jgi:hypothetical protein
MNYAPIATRPAREKEIMLQNSELYRKIGKIVTTVYKCSSFAKTIFNAPDDVRVGRNMLCNRVNEVKEV